MTGGNLLSLLAAALAAGPAAGAEGGAPLQLTKPPRLIHFVEAQPPPALETRGSAEVVLTIDVDETGQVTRVEVAQPAGDGFDEAAVEAARQFEFEPGEYQGKPVPVRITYRYHFLLKEPPAPAAPPPAPAPAVPTVPFGGRVLRRGDRTPLEGVSVLIDGGAPSARTDARGRFEFEAVPVGPHAVHLRGAEVAPSDGSVTLSAGKRLETTFYLEARERYASTVRAERAAQETVEDTLPGEELRRIPGTQGDTLKAVQNLPGVARAPFGGGQIAVWGSAPQDTRTYVDGVSIPTLYHFGGLRSTFNGEMVESLTFSPGGYGAEYGRGLGGVIEVENRRPRTDALHGFVQVDLLDGSFLVDGPLTDTLSLAVAARRSWIDIFLPLFTTSDFQLSPKYWDYQADLHWRPSSQDDVDFLLFGSDDSLHLVVRNSNPSESPTVDTHTYFHRGLVRWQHRFDGAATLETTLSLGYDVPVEFSFTEANADRTVSEKELEYSLRTVVRLPVTSWLRLDAGLDYEGTRDPVDAIFPPTGAPRDGDPPFFGFANGALAHDDYTLYDNAAAPFLAGSFSLLDRKLVVSPQLRLDVFTESAYHGTPAAFTRTFAEVEPRFTARYQVLPWLAPKLAFGIYHQAPQIFDVSRAFGSPGVTPERALHYVAGVDLDPNPTLHIEAEAFYKDLRNLIVRGEEVGGPLLVNDGVGRVYGGELLVRQELSHHFFGWISYTLSRSERRDHPDTSWRLFQYDQTHILTLLGSYQLPRGWQVGLRFRYVTGDPITPVASAYYASNADRYTPIYGAVYSARLGSFNQLDLRVDKTWTYDRWKLSVYLDVQNLYNRQNPEGLEYNFNYTQSQPQAGLPFLPVFGVRGEL